jgi:hypothetical protein
MTRVMLSACVVLALLGACTAEPFYLKHDKTGKIFGPYEFQNGAGVKIGGSTFTLVRTGPAPRTLKERLRQTIIPAVEFREANVFDVLDFFRQASREHGPTAEARRTGVNIISRLEFPRETGAPAVTFNARNISLLEALDAVAQITRLKLRFDGNVLWVEHRE